MTMHVKYALMTSGRPTDRDFDVETQEEAEAELAKDLATGCSVVHGHVVDKETKQTIAVLTSGAKGFKAETGATGWTDK